MAGKVIEKILDIFFEKAYPYSLGLVFAILSSGIVFVIAASTTPELAIPYSLGTGLLIGLIWTTGMWILGRLAVRDWGKDISPTM